MTKIANKKKLLSPMKRASELISAIERRLDASIGSAAFPLQSTDVRMWEGYALRGGSSS